MNELTNDKTKKEKNLKPVTFSITTHNPSIFLQEKGKEKRKRGEEWWGGPGQGKESEQNNG